VWHGPRACDKVAHAVVVAGCFVGTPRVSCALQCDAKRHLHQGDFDDAVVVAECPSLVWECQASVRKWRGVLQPEFLQGCLVV
jgi:hypothetical protein